MKKSTLATLSALTALLSFGSASALADGAANVSPVSKENTSFEAQGNNEVVKSIFSALGSMFGAIAKNTDGTVSVSQAMITSTKGDFNQTSVSIETRVYGVDEKLDGDSWCDEGKSKCYHQGALLVPLEVRVRADSTNMTEAEIADLKVGVLRLMMSRYSLTIQALSYVYHKNAIGLGSRDGLELASMTFNDVTTLSSAHGIELVYKVTAAVGFGGMYSNPARDAARDQQQGAKVLGNDGGPSFTSSASIGVRFSGKVLAEFFGGYSYLRDEAAILFADSDGAPDKHSEGRYTQMTERSKGASIRYTPTQRFNARLSIQNTGYKSDSEYRFQGGTQASDSQNATEVAGTIELRW